MASVVFKHIASFHQQGLKEIKSITTTDGGRAANGFLVGKVPGESYSTADPQGVALLCRLLLLTLQQYKVQAIMMIFFFILIQIVWDVCTNNFVCLS